MHLESKTRRGMVLFIVVAMLALFAVVSVAFYYYATQESMASRLTLDAQQRLRPDPDALFAYVLRQLVFDEAGNGPFKSHMATHSLLRNLFGSEGLEPFSGTGRLHGRDYSYYSSSYYDTYYATCYVNRSYDPARDGSCNPPYTFPDFNHCFLGRITTDGPTGSLVVLEQSFIRRSVPGSPGLGGVPPSSYFDPYDPVNIGFWNNPNWPDPNSPMPVALRQAIVFRPHPLLQQFDPATGQPRFPPPADIGGDVRNLPPGIPVKILAPDPKTGQLVDTGLRHYGNDSIWMDLGFPVQTGPDGRTYKPLFAFFITDLDGRLNLNQVFWNQGLIFVPGESPGGLNGHHEMEAILRHGDTLADSFTSLLFPKLRNTMTDLRRRHMLTTYSADLRYAGFVPQVYRESSTKPDSWDGSPSQNDAKNNIVYPAGNPDLGPRWAAYPMQYRVPPGDTEPPTSRTVNWDWGPPFQPNQQALKNPLNIPYRNQGDFLTVITTAKNGQPIGIWTGRTATFVNRYDQQGKVIGTANFPSRQRLDLRSRVSSLPAYPPVVNLDNPRLDPTTNLPEPRRQQLAKAIAARQNLAREIYFRLLLVCGLLDEDPVPITSPPPAWVFTLYPSLQGVSWPPQGVPPRWPPTGVRARVLNPTSPTPQELQPLRFLAQLAVNIVDFLDPDDYSTPFMFYTDMDGYPLDDPSATDANGNPKYWVFGTEKPRVVINEVLFEYQEPYDNVSNVRMDGPFDMRCWVELLNASGANVVLGPDDPNAGNPDAVDLSRYQIVIANARNAGNTVDQLAGAGNGENVLGSVPGQDLRSQTSNSDFLQPPPAGQTSPTPPWALNSTEALVIGPTGDTVDGTLAATNPPKRIQSDNLKFSLDRNGKDWKYMGNVEPTKEYFVLLRRLAYPEMRRNQGNLAEVHTAPATVTVIPNTGVGAGWVNDFDPGQNPLVFNPYLTYDYTWVKQNQGLCDRTNNAGQSISWARTHPYADSRNQQHNNLDPNPITVNGNPTNTWHSLGSINPDPSHPSKKQADDPALYHPNAAVRTMDLLKVSAFKQHLLTQRFLKSDPSYPNYHYAPWFDEPPGQGQTARIYRALEFLEITPDNLAKMNVNPSAHRTVGKVNINTATPEEIFFALTDATQRPRWNAVYSRREIPSPTGLPGPIYGFPIYGFAPGQIAASTPPLPNGFSREDSWWRMDSAGTSQVFLDAFPNPIPDPLHEQANLFADLYDKITTRSNVFAVWCTVGFFEVDPQTGKLGPEIDADVGRQVRYRFFAIVDRTIIAEWMLKYQVPVETQLGRTDVDPRRPAAPLPPSSSFTLPNPNTPPIDPCVIYWSRIQ